MDPLVEAIERFVVESGAPLIGRDIASDLKAAVDSTRKWVRGLDDVEQIASDFGDEAKRLKRLAGSGNEEAMRKNDFSQLSRKWTRAVNKVYGDFADGRSAMMRIAKIAGVPTRRYSGRRPRSVPATGMTNTKMLKTIQAAAGQLSGDIRSSAEKGAFAIRKAEEIQRRLGGRKPLEGDKLREELGAWVAAWIEFRDLVSAGFFMRVGAITKRVNEFGARLFNERPGSYKASRGGRRAVNAEFSLFEPMVFEWADDDDVGWVFDVLTDDEAGVLSALEQVTEEGRGFSSVSLLISRIADGADAGDENAKTFMSGLAKVARESAQLVLNTVE
jgi:hypothetical protein